MKEHTVHFIHFVMLNSGERSTKKVGYCYCLCCSHFLTNFSLILENKDKIIRKKNNCSMFCYQETIKLSKLIWAVHYTSPCVCCYRNDNILELAYSFQACALFCSWQDCLSCLNNIFWSIRIKLTTVLWYIYVTIYITLSPSEVEKTPQIVGCLNFGKDTPNIGCS